MLPRFAEASARISPPEGLADEPEAVDALPLRQVREFISEIDAMAPSTV